MLHRARAPTLLALLARRQAAQQQAQQAQAQAVAAAASVSSGGGDGAAPSIAATTTVAAAAAATTTTSAWGRGGLLQHHPWAADAHCRTFFSWSGSGRNANNNASATAAPKPPPVDLDGDAGAAGAASAAASSPLPRPPLVSLDDAAAASSPTAAGTGLLDAATSSPPIIDSAAAADLSAAAAAVVDATRSAEAEAFVAAAADVWAPTRAFMSLFEAASEAWGLPWWATIALVNLGVRCASLPLTLYTQKKAGGMAAINEKMAQVRELAAASSRATSMREFQALQARRAALMAELQAKHGGELRSSLVVPALGAVNAAVLISQFSAVSTLASEGVPSMARGGTLWFPDLTVPDAKYGLAAVCSALTLAMIEFGGLNELGQTMPGMASGGMRWFLRGTSLLFLPMGAYVPAAVGVLWVGNSVLSLVQSRALKSPGLRKALGLPDMAKVRADQRKALGGAAAGKGGLFGALAAAAGDAGGASKVGGGGGGGAASASSGAPPPGQAPASSLLSTGRLYAQPAPSRNKTGKQIRAEVEKRLRG